MNNQNPTIIPETPGNIQRRIIPETPGNIQRRIIPETPITGYPTIIPETPISGNGPPRMPRINNTVNRILQQYSIPDLKKVCKRIDRIIPETPITNKYKTPKYPHLPGIVPETPINNIEEVNSPIPEKYSAKRKLKLYTNKESEATNNKPVVEKAINSLIKKRKQLEQMNADINTTMQEIKNQGITEQDIINEAYVSNAKLIKQYCNANNITKNSFTMSNQNRLKLEEKCKSQILSSRFFQTMENANKEEIKLQTILQRLKAIQSRIKKNTPGKRRNRNNNNNLQPNKKRINPNPFT